MQDGGDRTPALRATDGERERAVLTLRDGAAHGRLTFDELAERTELAYAATTGAELERLVADLPQAAAETAPGAPQRRRRWNVAVLAGCERKGRWWPASRSVALAVLGGIELDLREAAIEGDELVLQAIAVLGGIEIVAPEGVEVHVDGFAVLGGNDHEQADAPIRPGGPVIRVRAYAVLGGVHVTVKGRTALPALDAS